MSEIQRNKNVPRGRQSPRSGPGGFAADSWTDAEDKVASEMNAENGQPVTIPHTLPEYSLKPLNRPADFLLFRREKLDLEAPYQRGSVWDLGRRQNLLRSMLMGLPIGAVVLNKRYSDRHPVRIQSGSHPEALYGIIDGKQRIEALRAMADGEFGIPAEWVPERFRGALVDVEFRDQLVPGVRVDSEDHPFFAHLCNFPIPAIEAEVATIEEEAEIFLLINFAGVAQTDADRANATVVLTNGASDRNV